MIMDSTPVEKSVLFKIAESGNLDELKRIVEYTGTNLNENDDEGNNILAYAAKSRNPKIARYLVERASYSPLSGNNRGVTPYDIAYKNGNKPMLDYFESAVGFSYENGYHNPIRRGFFPDPSVIRVGDDYYMVNSTFHFFPAIPVSHSRDLVHWEIIGYAITDPEWSKLDDKDGGRGYWAPDISYCDGRFYITATLRCNENDSEKRIQMVTSSASPEGPYDEPSWIHEDGIDSSIFHDDDGKKYMLLNRGARIFELSSDCRRKISDVRLLWYGVCRRNPEGPHLIKKDGYYYLFLAEGGTGMGHRVTCARSRDLFGVYEPCPYNPIVRQMDSNQILQCCGHGMPVSTPDGHWYIAYLTLRHSRDGYGFTGRETCLDSLEWTADGWPLVNNGAGPGVFGRIPDGKAEGSHRRGNLVYPMWKGRVWTAARPLDAGSVSINDDRLLLKGSGYDLCSKKCRSILVERQQEFDFDAECTLKAAELEEGQSIGMVSYYDENSYIKFGLARKNGSMGLLLAEYSGDGYISSSFVPADNIPDEITLKQSCRGRRRVFSALGIELAVDNAIYLASEGLTKGKRFTGATAGVYVEGGITGEFISWNTVFYREDCPMA